MHLHLIVGNIRWDVLFVGNEISRQIVIRIREDSREREYSGDVGIPLAELKFVNVSACQYRTTQHKNLRTSHSRGPVLLASIMGCSVCSERTPSSNGISEVRNASALHLATASATSVDMLQVDEERGCGGNETLADTVSVQPLRSAASFIRRGLTSVHCPTHHMYGCSTPTSPPVRKCLRRFTLLSQTTLPSACSSLPPQSPPPQTETNVHRHRSSNQIT